MSTTKTRTGDLNGALEEAASLVAGYCDERATIALDAGRLLPDLPDVDQLADQVRDDAPDVHPVAADLAGLTAYAAAYVRAACHLGAGDEVYAALAGVVSTPVDLHPEVTR